MDKAITIFRTWKDSGDVIALFPEIPADRAGRCCESYMHVGQHGAADPAGVVLATRPAGRAEYLPLLRELRGRGYRPIIRRRLSRKYRSRLLAELSK